METTADYQRPEFDEVLEAWKALLAERGLPTDCVWIFDENLVFEADPSRPTGFRMGYQTKFAAPPQDAERLGYEYLSGLPCPLVIYRAGSAGGKSVCLLLSDELFRGKGETEGYLPGKAGTGILMRPGGPETLEEITEEARWKGRILRDRPLHELDFCMNLRAVHEMLAHGRVLSSYEHFALRFLHLWRRMLKQPD
jgi:hypothetical protein